MKTLKTLIIAAAILLGPLLVLGPFISSAQAQYIDPAAKYQGFRDTTAMYVAPVTGATINIPPGVYTVIVNPAAGIAALTLNLPACVAANHENPVSVSFGQAVTTLTLGATSGTVIAAPVTAVAGTKFSYFCWGPTTTWFTHD